MVNVPALLLGAVLSPLVCQAQVARGPLFTPPRAPSLSLAPSPALDLPLEPAAPAADLALPDFSAPETLAVLPRAHALAPLSPLRELAGAPAKTAALSANIFDGSRPRAAPPQPAWTPEAPVDLDPDLALNSRRWNTRTQRARLRDLPEPADGRFSFAVVGDAEPGRFAWSRALFNVKDVFARHLARIRGDSTWFVIQLGDMVSRGIPENFRKFFGVLNASGLHKPYFTAAGNHDRRFPHGEQDLAYYASIFGRPDYAFDFGGVRFVFVDSSLLRVEARQLAWLDAALDTGLKKVVITHVPPSQLERWTYGGKAGGIKGGSAEFTALMTKHRVDRVYVGHHHGVGEMLYDGVRYVLTGGGGSPLYPGLGYQRMHHYLRVEVTPDGIRDVVVPDRGAPKDLLTLTLEWMRERRRGRTDGR